MYSGIKDGAGEAGVVEEELAMMEELGEGLTWDIGVDFGVGANLVVRRVLSRGSARSNAWGRVGGYQWWSGVGLWWLLLCLCAMVVGIFMVDVGSCSSFGVNVGGSIAFLGICMILFPIHCSRSTRSIVRSNGCSSRRLAVGWRSIFLQSWRAGQLPLEAPRSVRIGAQRCRRTDN